jgi:hypothetical protein
LRLRIESQNNQIIELNNRINELNKQVITNQKECTDEIVRREGEILNMINDIDNYTNKIKNETRIVNSESRRVYRVSTNDTLENMMSMIPQTSNNSTTVIQNNRDEKLIRMIKNLKKKVSKGIEK